MRLKTRLLCPQHGPFWCEPMTRSYGSPQAVPGTMVEVDRKTGRHEIFEASWNRCERLEAGWFQHNAARRTSSENEACDESVCVITPPFCSGRRRNIWRKEDRWCEEITRLAGWGGIRAIRIQDFRGCSRIDSIIIRIYCVYEYGFGGVFQAIKILFGWRCAHKWLRQGSVSIFQSKASTPSEMLLISHPGTARRT